MPQCKKCQKRFPSSIVIDGKRKKLDTRVFCLECNPYKSNTRNIMVPSKNSKEKNAAYMANYYKERSKRKKELVDLKGGKCIHCGYNRCINVLSFHHRDPSQKTFSLSKNVIWKIPWNELLTEIEKCDLVCMNCHGEIHAKENKRVANICGDVLDS